MSNSRQNDELKRLILQMPRAEAQIRVQSQIKKGHELLGRRIASASGLNRAKADMATWSDYNKELLRTIVNTDELQEEYLWSVPELYPDLAEIDLIGKIDNFRLVLRELVRRLESVHHRLELLPERSHVNPSSGPLPAPPRNVSKQVFVVHGHDEEAKQSVARCIERLGFAAIILQEEADQGRTIIEKFEAYADVDFAVVLLTPDDIGASKKDQDGLRPRARQNVILELGFFIGKLGRKHVCALHKGDVELPSDFSGILWTPMDAGGAWQFKLAREMREAGLDVDVNKLL